MRTMILSAALALGALAFVSTPAAEAGGRWWGRPGVGFYGGFYGGRSFYGPSARWGAYGHGWRGYYGSPYRGGYYGARPYSSYRYGHAWPGHWGNNYYRPAYRW